jgi:hypothetical protein
MVKEVLGDEPKVKKVIDELWQRYPRGLVAYLQAAFLCAGKRCLLAVLTITDPSAGPSMDSGEPQGRQPDSGLRCGRVIWYTGCMGIILWQALG